MTLNGGLTGNVDRLWLLYEVHCESAGAPALFGEVRLNEPSSGPNAYAEPTAVVWPGTDIGRPTRVVPITVFAGPSVRTVSSVALTGAAADAFTIRLDQCTGHALAVDASCQVFARYAPTGPGTTDGANLRVTLTDGTRVDIARSGLLVSVSCNHACTASISIRGVTAPQATGSTKVSLRAGIHKRLRLRVRGGATDRLAVTSTARQTAAPHGVTRMLTRHVNLPPRP